MACLPMCVIPALVIASALSICPVHVLGIGFVVPTYLIELVAVCSITAHTEGHTGSAMPNCKPVVKVCSLGETGFDKLIKTTYDDPFFEILAVPMSEEDLLLYCKILGLAIVTLKLPTGAAVSPVAAIRPWEQSELSTMLQSRQTAQRFARLCSALA
ncbi:hypothetical protein FFLO_06254 [Filobasidium floriforme]|uniref:Uncharacterized protein n=1 Tax=Filobasidium floriforme TaxID=5210 RepID=A0A8K0NQM6_9TREE|nr:uncharacterized protein HD553DRAFT_321873 [Filobasidium floriforme]KAG7528314.1 hypothetical protein FFLO_06254 [Filobasidium floriforme]KAH8089834.1 hypothetical protein HD553DRAFT_321873 [Filobasidium floriforme]